MPLGTIERADPSPPRFGLRRTSTSRSVWAICVIGVVAFAAIAPTLPLLEFTGGMENANVATAMEAARDGRWLLPTLNGEPRTEKPPLAEWITACGILSSDSLAWGARWPTLAMACLTVVAVGYLGHILGGPRVGWLSAVIYASTGFFLKYARQASYDMPMSLWVAAAEVFVARAMFRRDWLWGGLGAGVCLGLAMMTKGPVALLEVVVPAIVYAAAVRSGMPRHSEPIRTWSRRPLAGILAGTAAMLLSSLPWTVFAARRLPERVQQWTGEVTRQVEVAHASRGAWYDYVCVLPHMLPWTGWLFAGGLAVLLQSCPAARRARLALCWFLIPLFLMSFFPARRDRYALPMAAAGSVLAAWGLRAHLHAWRRHRIALDKVLVASHLLVVALVVPAIALVAVFWWHTSAGTRTCSIPLAVGATAVSCAFAGAAWRGHRAGGKRSLVLGTAATMLLAQAFFIWCYRGSAGGRSEGKPLIQRIRADYPDSIVYNPEPGVKNLPTEFSIYLNAPVRRLDPSVRLTPQARPQIIVQPSSSPTADPPAGFSTYTSARVNGRWFHAYLLPATPPPDARP